MLSNSSVFTPKIVFLVKGSESPSHVFGYPQRDTAVDRVRPLYWKIAILGVLEGNVYLKKLPTDHIQIQGTLIYVFECDIMCSCKRSNVKLDVKSFDNNGDKVSYALFTTREIVLDNLTASTSCRQTITIELQKKKPATFPIVSSPREQETAVCLTKS